MRIRCTISLILSGSLQLMFWGKLKCWVSFVMVGLYALSPMHTCLHTECFWSGSLVDCSVGFVSLLITSQEWIPWCPWVDEMVGSIPALQMEDLEVDKVQCRAEDAYLSLFLGFQKLCIQAVDNLDLKHWIIFFFWNAVVDAYYFWKTDLTCYMQSAFVKEICSY